ncbi:hypothetical protein E4U43_008731 [Claviceps pusilla]|uniref:Zn(2)-C6 fungal-type domain-containing protein n=1 Tax=Claviceps pusilla TaxID=123648 RepID=A0A9P7NAE1_9HYPO|nr:hypothetical protein E4U43_008731 [Claviceps pusilla]
MDSAATGRKRSKLACQTCRDLKRRCDGEKPCGTCVRFEYHCVFHEGSKRGGRKQQQQQQQQQQRQRQRQHHHGKMSPAGVSAEKCPPRSMSSPKSIATSSAVAPPPPPPPPPQNQARSLEANSGSAFVQRLALRLDPKRSPRMQTFAWNTFLGSRAVNHTPVSRPLTLLLTQKDMQDLAVIYFQQVNPTYGFLDRARVTQQIRLRWTINPAHDEEVDAVLCGIAALGCLFSNTESDRAEHDLVESARSLLHQATHKQPSATCIAAWLLRVTYLRLAGTHYEAWMASCTVMHMIEAGGLPTVTPTEQDTGLTLRSTHGEPDMGNGPRMLLVAQHLNTWMSFDMGLTRVALASMATTDTQTQTQTPLPRQGEGDFTCEITELLPYTVELDPERRPTPAELESALRSVLKRVHSIPPTILAQCNLALCLCRRLRSMDVALTEPVLQQILHLTTNAIHAARSTLEARAPWHHMAYIPFQIVCVLLAIDTASSISQLRDAMQCLQAISLVYNTPATQDALKTARSLVLLHQRGKEMFALALNDILKLCPVQHYHHHHHQQQQQQHHHHHHHSEATTDGSTPLPDHPDRVEEESYDSSHVQYLDIEHLLGPEFFWNAGSNGML